MYGVYVHVPFCDRRCDYCAFATWTDRHHLMADYAAACVTSLGRAGSDSVSGVVSGPLSGVSSGPKPGPRSGVRPGPQPGVRQATSVFFGGGTPSLLPAPLLVSILDAVDRVPGAEVTVECNPETVTAPLLGAYRAAGVTRLSFGVQSMVPHVLGSLGRLHDLGSVRHAVALAGDAGYGDHYSVDLIMGAAGESVEDWRSSLQGVLSLDPAPSHVSAYGLTVEPGTPLARDPRRAPDPDDQADKYLLAEAVLSDAGLNWYEVSNWAQPGAECRHNQLYWDQGEYLGVGCAAHSHSLLPPSPSSAGVAASSPSTGAAVAGATAGPGAGGSRRWWNVRTPDRFISLVAAGASVEAAGEDLDAEERRLEGLQLALRTRTGVPAGALEDDPLLEGLVERVHDREVLTLKGRLLANEVALRLR